MKDCDGCVRKFIKLKEKAHEKHARIHGELHRQQEGLGKHIDEFSKSKAEFHKLHRNMRISRPLILLLNLLIWYWIFRYEGLKAINIFFAILFGLGGFMMFFYIRRLERRIITPIDRLRAGVEEISKGNYGVKVDGGGYGAISPLINSFNEMALKLQESEKMKLEYEESRRALIANISHDLKTPITSIQGYIEAITEGGPMPPGNVEKYLKIIHRNAEYMNRLIDDLFLFSKLDMHKLEFEFVSVRVKPFIRDLMEEFKLEAEDKGIRFEYTDGLTEDCSIDIDRKRLHQVFRNIIGNAVKYGTGLNLAIDIRLYRQEGFICVDVRDNGPGIPEDKLPRIFERFYRIDAERTKDFMSTGLGLSIAKELVEAHGGRISAASAEGAGSCFTVCLPAAGQINMDGASG